MTDEMRKLLEVLRAHVNESGEVPFCDVAMLKEWIGSEAGDWDIHSMMIAHNDAGAFSSFYAEGIGSFNVRLR